MLTTQRTWSPKRHQTIVGLVLACALAVMPHLIGAQSGQKAVLALHLTRRDAPNSIVMTTSFEKF